MSKVVITGANGFIGKNLLAHLQYKDGLEVVGITRNDTREAMVEKLKGAAVVYHLAGVNRPVNTEEFQQVNTAFTEWLVNTMEAFQQPYKIIYSSSTQAALDNPYGQSKKAGEQALEKGVKQGEAVIYRLPGVFGKWCRPDYNSVVATFCHNLAKDLPIEIRDPAYMLTLVYVDDVVKEFVQHLPAPAKPGVVSFGEVTAVHQTTLGDLAATIRSFKTNRDTLFIPKVGNGFEKALYSTWLTYLPADAFSYPLTLRTDERGSLFELLKSPDAGQIFLSTTLPGITRGNHFHHTKTEKFVVIQGEGMIRFRQIDGTDVIEYPVSGARPQVVDIPPGYTHNITNTGNDVMITLFWANEIFDQQAPDTYFVKV